MDGDGRTGGSRERRRAALLTASPALFAFLASWQHEQGATRVLNAPLRSVSRARDRFDEQFADRTTRLPRLAGESN